MERRSATTITVFCSAQVLAQLGGFTFAALLPTLLSEWQLSHGQAGWLSGIFFGAYALSVVFLLPLTDRISAKKVYVVCAAVTALSHLGMALTTHSFVTALLFRVLAGIGWAGTYMVGLRALTDELTGATASRAVALNAASIGASGALSFALAGWMATWLGWQSAFVIASIAAVAALLIAVIAFPTRAAPNAPKSGLLHFGPVFKNRSAMAYSLSYCVHTWETFVVRSWVVTYLTFALLEDGGSWLWLAPTVVAMVMELMGTASSVIGSEIAMRVGRRRWVLGVMVASMACAVAVGFASALGYGATIAVCVLYNTLIYADSAAITAGTLAAAEPARKGTTLAVHALFGYGGGFVGPLIMGLTLDALGGESVRAWGLGFGHLAVIMLVGPMALLWLRPRH